MIRQKVEIRFEKGEALRFISHHDLMRAMMRAARRANLPVRLTAGFNPRPRIVFPVALEVGVVSLDEVAEIEFTQCLDIQEVSSRLASVFPPGLTLKTVTSLPARTAARTPSLIRYRLLLQGTGLQVGPPRLLEILQARTLPFRRPREKRIQDVDLRPALLDIGLEADGNLIIDVRPTPKGSVRPLEVLSLLLNLPLPELRQVKVLKLRMDLGPPPQPNP